MDALAHDDDEGRSKPAKVIGEVQTTVIPDRLRMRQLKNIPIGINKNREVNQGN